MTFLGEGGWPAPQLHEVPAAALTTKGWTKLFLQTVFLVRALWQRCGLCHGDLGEYNLLLHRKAVHVIDLGQAVGTSHPRAREYLRRDLGHVRAFFGTRRRVAFALEHSVEALEALVTEKDALPSDDLDSALLKAASTAQGARSDSGGPVAGGAAGRRRAAGELLAGSGPDGAGEGNDADGGDGDGPVGFRGVEDLVAEALERISSGNQKADAAVKLALQQAALQQVARAPPQSTA